MISDPASPENKDDLDFEEEKEKSIEEEQEPIDHHLPVYEEKVYDN